MAQRFKSLVLIRDSRLRRVAGRTAFVCLVLSPLLLGLGYAVDLDVFAHASVWGLGLMLVAIVVYFIAASIWTRQVEKEADLLREAVLEVTNLEMVVRWKGVERKPWAAPLSSIIWAWPGDEGRVEIVLDDNSEVVVGGLSSAEQHELFRALGTTAAETTAVRKVPSLAESKTGCAVIPSLVAIPIAGCLGFVLLVALIPATIGLGAVILEARFGAALFLVIIGGVFNLIVFGALYLLVEFHRRRKLTIGTDGVALTTTGLRTFVPMSRIKEVRYEPGGVRLIHHDRPDIFFPGAKESLARRIQAAIDVGGESDELTPRLGLLDQGAKSIEEWSAALRKLVAKEGFYRDASFQPSQLTDLAVDADLLPERRIAAAFALSTVGNDVQIKAVLRAAKACADENLRRALERATEGEILERELEAASRHFHGGG